MNHRARFPQLTPEQEQARRLKLRRTERGLSNYVEERDVQDAGPRCGVCGLLEPHECLRGEVVRR